MPESASRLTVNVEDDLVVVVGDIDAHSCPDLAAGLDPLPGSADVRLDLTGVDFMDSSGLRVIIAAHQRADDLGRRLVLERSSPAVRRIIEISGLADHLHFGAID